MDLINARCICGRYFIGMSMKEFNQKVTRHIWEVHRDEDPDRPLIRFI